MSFKAGDLCYFQKVKDALIVFLTRETFECHVDHRANWHVYVPAWTPILIIRTVIVFLEEVWYIAICEDKFILVNNVDLRKIRS